MVLSGNNKHTSSGAQSKVKRCPVVLTWSDRNYSVLGLLKNASGFIATLLN